MAQIDELVVFSPGEGIPAPDLNDNFEKLRVAANANETALAAIATTALRADGSNVSQDLINQFNRNSPIVLSSASGSISLEDNADYFVTLAGNATIVLPTVPADVYSHTITMVVDAGGFTLNLGTANHLVNNDLINPANPYAVMYIYSKIDNTWYYNLTQ